MKEIRFSRTDSAACPAYKDYYIQDRVSGRNIYGHESYEYALFLKRRFVLVKKCRTRKQAYQYVGDLAYITKCEVDQGSRRVVRERNWLGVYTHDGMFKIIKRTNEVLFRPLEDERLTNWHFTYQDCLAEAKEIIGAEMR